MRRAEEGRRKRNRSATPASFLPPLRTSCGVFAGRRLAARALSPAVPVRVRACTHARRIRRLQNEEADALTNSDFRHFSESKRIHVDLDKLPFKIMNDLFAEGEDYLKELAELKVQDAALKDQTSTPQKKARKKAADSLRESQPW